MKTKKNNLFLVLLCLGGFLTLQAQGLYNLATLDEEDEPPRWTQSDLRDVREVSKRLARLGTGWSKYTAGGGAGFGWNDNNGNSETSVCFNAEFLAKVVNGEDGADGAGYLGAFMKYVGSSSDNADENVIRAGAKFSYFDRITALNEVQLIYGAQAFYETGSRDFSGFKDDITGYGASIYTGVNVRLNNNVSVGVECPILSYVSRTFKNGGSEIESDAFSLAINKNNPITATARFNLKWGSQKDTDGDGIYDIDDRCPETPGFPEFDGCPSPEDGS